MLELAVCLLLASVSTALLAWLASFSRWSFLATMLAAVLCLLVLWVQDSIHFCGGNGIAHVLGFGILMLMVFFLLIAFVIAACRILKKRKATANFILCVFLGLCTATLAAYEITPELVRNGPCSNGGHATG